MDTSQWMRQSQRPPSHGTTAERRVDAPTGHRLETQEVVPPCEQRGQTEWRVPLQWRQVLQSLAVLLCLVVVLHACRSL